MTVKCFAVVLVWTALLSQVDAGSGGKCVDDCTGQVDGNHPSCDGPEYYVTCDHERIFKRRPCPDDTVYDDSLKGCNHITAVQGSNGQLSQSDIDRIADDLQLKAKTLDNLNPGTLFHTIRFTLTNTGTADIADSGWVLYFHSFFLPYPDIIPKVAKYVDLDLEKVRVSFIQGDLYTIQPIEGFKPIKPQASRYIDLTKQYWSVTRSDYMPRFYVTAKSGNAEPRILKSTMDMSYVELFEDVRQWKRYPSDRFNPFTAQQRFERLNVEDTNMVEKLVIPTPKIVNVGNVAAGTIKLDQTWLIYKGSEETSSSADYLGTMLNIGFTTDANAGKTIKLMILSHTGNVPEAYTLTIVPSQNMIQLTGRDEEGLFYAVQSLLSIGAGYNNMNIPAISITDEPRYPYRGMHIDVSRNFHSVDDIKRLLNGMAMYKLNKLHMHLADDEGWRLEIPGIPELTEVGGKRCHDLTEQECIIPQYGSGPSSNTSGTGYYTVNDYKDILRYANDRHIEVIPELDMPGHAHAAIVSMEKRYKYYINQGNSMEANRYRLIDPLDKSYYKSVQNWLDNAINPCVESTFTFIGKVIDEVKAMHEGIQPLKIYHHGGDEVARGAWEDSPACLAFIKNNPEYNIAKGIKKYFVTRVASLTSSRGLALAGWEDGLMNGEGLPFDRSAVGNMNMYGYSWQNVWEWGASQRAHTLANAGYKVVMSQASHLFFDHPYEPDPEERGLYWAPRFTDTYKVFSFLPDSLYDNIDTRRNGEPITLAEVCEIAACDPLEKTENIIGIQGQMWSETIRTREHMDYMIYPRLLALAERAWHKAEFESTDASTRQEHIDQEWKAFANTVGYKELARLEKLGIKYRVPPPGARVNGNNMIEVSTTFPGLTTEISYDKGASWTEVIINDLPYFPALDSKPYKFVQACRLHHKRLDSGILTTYKNTVLYNVNKEKVVQRPFGPFDQVTEVRERKPAPVEPLSWSYQSIIDYIGHYVNVKVAVIDNLNKINNFIKMELYLENTGSQNVYAGTWKIYLYSLYGLRIEDLNCGLRTGHVNGGLYYVTPRDSMFPGIMAGQTLHCTFNNQWWSVARTDQFPNWYTASVGIVPKVIKNTADESLSFVGDFDTKEKWKRTREDQYDPLTPLQRYNNFTRGDDVMNDVMVVPRPYNVSVDTSSMVDIDIGSEWKVQQSTEFPWESEQLAKTLRFNLETTLPSSKYIQFVKAVTDYDVTESYHIDVDPAIPAITITANDKAGAFYGVQTLIALVTNHGGKLTKMTIKDKPRFSYRGMMVDTSRNFKSKETMFKLLDTMAMYKLNKLHFHLTDDEGWRIQIPDIPELTEVGANRCHSDYQDMCIIPQLGSGPDKVSPGSGYYTVQDYQEILMYAWKRHIEIIPEVDMPGHSTSAIHAMDRRENRIQKQMINGADDVDKSYALKDLDENIAVESPQKWRLNAMNPCLETTYDFVREVVETLKMLHEPSFKLKSFHIGGDEVPVDVWNTSEACLTNYPGYSTKDLQRMFVKRAAAIVASFDLDLGVWEDGVYANNEPNPITDFTSENVYVYPWNSRWELGLAKRVSEFVDKGYKVVLPLATHLYFDMPQEQDPEERGLYWASRVTDIRKVFGFIPDDIFANADVTRMGVPVTPEEACGTLPCPQPTKPENVIGVQAVMFSETMRTEEQFHHMGFPRTLALAERAWHKASWEDVSDVTTRNSQLEMDFGTFIRQLGEKELPRLELNHIQYRVPPPGAKIEDGTLKVNTRFPNHPVEYSLDGNTWVEIHDDQAYLPNGKYTVRLRSKSPVLGRYSRVVEIEADVVGKPSVLSCIQTCRDGNCKND